MTIRHLTVKKKGKAKPIFGQERVKSLVLLWDLMTCEYLGEMMNISAPRSHTCAKEPAVWKRLNVGGERVWQPIEGVILAALGGRERLSTSE